MFSKAQNLTPEQLALLQKVNKAEREIKLAKFKMHLKSPRWLFWMFFKYLTFFLASVAVLVPPYSVFITSFKSIDQYYDTSISKLHAEWSYFSNFDNSIKAFDFGNLGTGFINTAIILGISLILTIIFGTQVAYVLSRFNFRGKKLVILLYLMAMLIPAITTQVATFQVIYAIDYFFRNFISQGFANAIIMWKVIVLYVGADVVMIYVFLQFMKGIPMELDEAAKIEGASYWTIYLKIILPLLKPAIATIIILRTIYIYNDFYFPLLYLPDMQTVSTALYHFVDSPTGTQPTLLSAGVVIVLIPSIIGFLLLQKQIYAGVTNGAVKG